MFENMTKFKGLALSLLVVCNHNEWRLRRTFKSATDGQVVTVTDFVDAMVYGELWMGNPYPDQI